MVFKDKYYSFLYFSHDRKCSYILLIVIVLVALVSILNFHTLPLSLKLFIVREADNQKCWFMKHISLNDEDQDMVRYFLSWCFIRAVIVQLNWIVSSPYSLCLLIKKTFSKFRIQLNGYFWELEQEFGQFTLSTIKWKKIGMNFTVKIAWQKDIEFSLAANGHGFLNLLYWTKT